LRSRVQVRPLFLPQKKKKKKKKKTMKNMGFSHPMASKVGFGCYEEPMFFMEIFFLFNCRKSGRAQAWLPFSFLFFVSKVCSKNGHFHREELGFFMAPKANS
jgi:hypothetical protein